MVGSDTISLSLNVLLLGFIFFMMLNLFADVIAPMINRAAGEEIVQIKMFADDSTQILHYCQEFHENYFSPDYDYVEKFRGVFPTTAMPQEKYRKAKYFCGGLLPIEEAIRQNRDLEATVAEVNEALGVELNAEDIRTMVEKEGPDGTVMEERQIWLSDLERELVEQLEGVR